MVEMTSEEGVMRVLPRQKPDRSFNNSNSNFTETI
jgi:hypothetical protein